MRHNPQVYYRRSIRLPGYDYTQPRAYFITIVTQNRDCLFGQVVDDQMQLSCLGQVASREWERLARRFARVTLGAFVIMPNHVHGIIVLNDTLRRGAAGQTSDLRHSTPGHTVGNDPHRSGCAPARDDTAWGRVAPGSIPAIVRAFKSAVTLRINLTRGTPGADIWQRNYYEHILRDDAELNRARQYIADNPLQWALDQENPYRSGEL